MNFKRRYPEYSCVLPSKNKEVFFRPFLVSDEKSLLLIKEEKNTRIIFRTILDLLESCFKNIDPKELTLQDMEYLFCNLRSKSIGETVKVNFTCPSTKENIETKVDLSKIAIVAGIKEKEISLDESTKIILKEPKVYKICHTFPKRFNIGWRFRSSDLLVMSQTRFLCATKHFEPLFNSYIILTISTHHLIEVGFEPTKLT